MAENCSPGYCDRPTSSYGKATPYFPVLDLLKRYAQVDDHDFALSHNDTSIIRTTPTGRATVQALRMNDDLIVTARECWVKGGW